MIIVGERINATRAAVAEALNGRNEGVLIREARAQEDAGCDFLDLNCGVGPGEKEAMEWLAGVLFNRVSVPFFFDSADAAVIEKGLAASDDPGRHVANSVPFDETRLSSLLPVVREYGCGVVGLLMDEGGIPDTVERRVEIAMGILDRFDAEGIGPDRVFLDPMVESIATDASRAVLAMRCIRELKRRIAPARIHISISGVSYGLPRRAILNRAFLPLVAEAGADAVMLDPLDRDMISALAATEALLGRDPYCLEYIKAHRQGRL